MRMLTQLF